MTDTPHTDNERKYTFQDIIEDPGLPYRMTLDELQVILDAHTAAELDRSRKVAGPNPDLSRPAKRKTFTAIAAQVSRNKVRLDDHGKKIVAGWKREAGEVDARRKLIRDAMDVLRDLIRAPVTEWEAREEARLQAEADKAAQEARDGQEALPATLTPDGPEIAAQPPEIDNLGTSAHAAPSVPMLTLSRDSEFVSFTDNETGSLIFRCSLSPLGRYVLAYVFDQARGALGARMFNTHGIELLNFDIKNVHGRI